MFVELPSRRNYIYIYRYIFKSFVLGYESFYWAVVWVNHLYVYIVLAFPLVIYSMSLDFFLIYRLDKPYFIERNIIKVGKRKTNKSIEYGGKIETREKVDLLKAIEKISVTHVL